MMKIIRNNMLRNRISKLSSSVLKKIAASALIFGSWGGANAQIITSDIQSACPGEAIEFTQVGFDAAAIDWERYDGTKWVKEDQIKATSHFVIEMGNTAMTIRAKAGSQVSNEITISRSTDCKNSCIQSSTGDFITGTDFDRKNSSEKKPAVPEGIESYFSDYNVNFTNQNQDYYVTNDLGSTFNGKYPILDNGKKENSYYVFSDNPTSSSPFTYQYPCKDFHGQNYRLVMRMYVMKQAGCSASDAQIKLETKHGNQTLDRALMRIYDNDNQLIKEDRISTTFGSVKLGIDNKYAGQLLRIDFTYYGYFPKDKYQPASGTYNGLVYYTMDPLFQQFDKCYTVAIDYLSAEVENVCLSPQMVCAGTEATTIAYATGFDSDATYKWEIQDERGKWVSLQMGVFDGKGDDFRRAVIPVTRSGKIYGRVIVKSKGFTTNGTVDIERTKEFTVTGKDCDPIYPDKIDGPNLICTPNTTSVYSVSPVDDDPEIFYRWTLKTPGGKVIESSTVYQGESEGMQSVNVKGSSVRLILPALSEHGEYSLSVQTVQRIYDAQGYYTDTPKGEPVVKKIKVHNTPTLNLTLTSSPDDIFAGTSESDKIICPSDIKNKYIANVEVTNKEGSHKYNYTWTGATSSTKTSSTAELSWDRTKACNGTLKSHTVSVTAEIDGVGCPADISKTYKFETPEDPTIDCSKIDGIVYPLGEKEKTMTIDLPMPTYSAGCDPDPKMTIDVVVKDLEGTVLKGTNQSRTISFSVSQLSTINKKVVAPAGTIELKYTITDGCGKSDFCVAIDSVKDVTPPNVNCDLIKNYTAHLKNQNGCVAVPGDYPTELPKLEPKLQDLNGVDGTLIGEYLGRREVEDRPSEIPSIFDKKKGLNDPYKKGVTWILWAFSDKSGNTKFCLQQITVIDDKAPNVTCPNVDLGSIDVDTLTCSLKPSSVIAKLKEVAKLPYGFDECSSTPTDSLVPTLYYRVPKDGDDLIEIKDDQMDDPIFVTGIKYEMVWVFKKPKGSYVDENVSVECAVPFMAEDQDAPEFDCSSLINIMVFPNYLIEKGEVKYDNYASGAGQSGNNPDKVYTLSKYFDEEYLSMHDDVQDVCGGEVTVTVTVTDHKGKTTKIKNLDEFKKFKFEGDAAGKDARTYTIKYTFTDQRFNTKECEQLISVVRNAPPVPNCPSIPNVMYTDKDCKAIFNMTLDKIPTAEVKYYHASRYGDCEGMMIGNDCSKMTPVTKRPGPHGVPLKFDEFRDLSASKSGFRTVTVYPDSVRLYDADGNITTIKNPLTDTDFVITKDVTFRTFQAGECNCKEDVVYGSATANLSNFTSVPSVVKNYNLPVGINRYVWYFSNAYEKDDPSSKSLSDSCVYEIEVKDTIAPTLVCGPWEGTSSFNADESCELSQADVNVKVPSLDDLKASDNCTATSDLKLSWVRTFKSKKSTDLSAPYKVGLTTIDWIVTDKSGNSDTCTQYIEVLDVTGPPVDCKVVTPPLTAYVDANCLAEVDVVKKAGLHTPEIDDDPCSPTGKKIKGVGVRSDGKDVMKDAYPKGVTTITWTFTDAAKNESVCKQTITVLDTMKPVFDCRNIQDTTIALAADKCELSLEEVLAALGNHTAEDNCDGDIEGKPMLRDKDDAKDVALPSSFHKDTTYHIVWHFIDKANNDKTCDQYMTVADTTPPDASDACKKLTDAEVTATDTCELPFTSLNVNLNSSIEDKCDGVIKAKVQAFVSQFDGSVERYDDEEIKNVMFPVGTHKFLYIYTDKANLSDTCTMYRTVKDGTKPVVLDCFDGKDTVMGNVSSDVCGMTYDDLKDLIILPKAYDECDNLANGGSVLFIDPVVKRYFWNISTKDFDLVVDGMDNEEWKVEPFPVGLTKLVFIFSDKSGNVDYCEKYVNVVDARGPSFDCSKITPNPYFPVAEEGKCEVVIGDIWDILNGDYVATRSCTDEKIPGVLTLYGTDKRVPSDYVLEVGRDYHLLWVFRSEIDGKVATCDQIIRPNHQNKLEPNCDNAADIDSIKATADRCDVPGDSVITKMPFALDACTADTVWGVPHRSDSLEISDPFPTGHTHITWTMVSPYNVEDTAKCEQDINIKGNKKFDINCDELTPAMHKIVEDCDPADLRDTLKTPEVEDPCAHPDSSYFMRPGVGVRSDSLKIEDTYPLGPTWIKWVFTDFTGSVKDSCDQLVDVRTTKTLEINCDSINKDTLNIPVKTGECSVPASQVLDSLEKRGYPYANHPCGLGRFKGTPTRPNGLTMNDPFYVGPNELIWVFIDSTTHTLVDSVVKCTQIVRVGDVNVPPVDCSQMPDTSVVLDPFDCDIDFSEFKFDIKAVYDLCSGDHIDSVVTRASLPGLSSKSGDDLFRYPFNVGVDTVYWRYNFGSYDFECTQTITVKDSMEPVIDCDTLLDETIVLPEGLCEILKEQVLDSIKQPYAYEYCSGVEIKGVPQLMTVSSAGDTTYTALPSKFMVGEPYTISWLFANDSLTVMTKRCEIELTIKSSTKPIFDCTVFNDTVKKSSAGECDVVLDEQILPIPEGKDACVDGYVVYGKGYMIDTVAGKPTYTLLAEMTEGTPSYKLGKLGVGVYNIAWVFESKYSTAKDTCVETLDILTDKKMDIACKELDAFAPTSDDSCSVSVDLIAPVATNPCTNEVILPDTVIRSDKKPFKGSKDTFYVGRTTVYWIYVDHSKTLKDSIDTCAQIIQVGDVKEDPIQCPKDTLITLPIGVCQLEPADIELNDSLPKFMDFCADTVVPLLKVWRASGKAITEKFDLGIDTIFRRYIYHGEEFICEQVIKVRNAGIDSFNCGLLGEKDTITIELKTAVDSVPFSEVLKHGFKIPELHNECGQLDSVYTRSDGLKLKDPYPLGLTTITLVVRDNTPGSEDTIPCHRVVNVINTGAPGMNCPPLDDIKYICYNDLPASYKTFDEFLKAGGLFLAQDGTSAPELVDPETFKVDSIILDVTNSKVSTVNLCEFTLIRTYSAVDVRKQNVSPCSDTFRVKDTVPPVWIEDAASTIDTFACTPIEPFANSAMKAKDNCWDVIYENPVATSADVPLKSGIFYFDSSDRSSDPSKCEYYNYDVVRSFVAYDACNNHSDTLEYRRVIRDTVPPIITIPDWFEESIIQADYARPCLFLVPDVDGLLPPDIASDNCDPEAVKHFKHTQIPPKGDTLNTEAGFIDVKIIIEDPCGLKDSLIKRVKVPTRNSIVKEYMKDTTVCVEDSILLSDTRLSYYEGYIWQKNWFDETKWDSVRTNSVVFDYFKDTISDKTVVFSNNQYGYAWRYNQNAGAGAYLKLDSYSKTGKYFIIATDTVRLCSDTASAFINVHQAPYVSLVSEYYTICENDSLPLISGDESLYDRFSVFTFDNGEEITEEGWMINGELYSPNSKIPYSNLPLTLTYYAKNFCGASSSIDGVSIHTKARMKPENFMLVTDPQNKPRVFRNESAELKLVTKYRPNEYHWYKVNGAFDGRFEEAFDKEGQIKEEYKDLVTEPDSLLEVKYKNEKGNNMYELIGLQDTASYYVLMLDSVCPAVPSNVVAINVIKDLPTAFTPMNSIGMNDSFMEGYPVVIFNRYGQKMVESQNGWDGKCRGDYVDPGVYFYEIILKDGSKHKGSIEVVYFK
ncbi:MAG: hypothetical protein UH850_03340 [Paludibacteraceae bacterium]|nr:hypothetical protein [Paludibacteraceae bacterium]